MLESARQLGMDRQITRRDVMHGFGALGAGLILPGALAGCSKSQVENGTYYPPELMGLRGNHDGAFEVAHALARDGEMRARQGVADEARER